MTRDDPYRKGIDVLRKAKISSLTNHASFGEKRYFETIDCIDALANEEKTGLLAAIHT